MKLVINSDRIIAALVRNSKCREIILSEQFEFLTIEFAKSEIYEHEEELTRKAQINKMQFEVILSILFNKIALVENSKLQAYMKRAKEIMDNVDPDDTPFIAAALASESDGLWTEDKHFDKQAVVKVFHTDDMVRLTEYY